MHSLAFDSNISAAYPDYNGEWSSAHAVAGTLDMYFNPTLDLYDAVNISNPWYQNMYIKLYEIGV